MVGDKAKYERLAKHRFTAAATKKTSNKDQVIRDQNLISQMVSLASDNNGSPVQGPTSVTVLVLFFLFSGGWGGWGVSYML